MLRCTIEIISLGLESAASPNDIIEIANDDNGDISIGNYAVALKKSPPWKGALKDIWMPGIVSC